MVSPLPSAMNPVRSEHTMEDYFRQFLGAQVLSIVQPEDKWSSLFVFQLMKNGVRSAFTLVGGSCGTTPPFCAEVREALLNSRFGLNDKDGVTTFIIAEMVVEDVRGFSHGRTYYWSAMVRITVSGGPQNLVFGDSEPNLCIGLWPLEPFMLGTSISLQMAFMREYLNLLEDLQVSAVEISPTGQLVVRILRSDCVLTATKEILVLDIDKRRCCACIYDSDEKHYYVDLPNLVKCLMAGCNKGTLFVESFKTTRLEGSHGRCPGQTVCVCYPLPQIWKASVEITLKWETRRIKIGQIPLCCKVNICDIRAMGFWPGTVPFFHGVV